MKILTLEITPEIERELEALLRKPPTPNDDFIRKSMEWMSEASAPAWAVMADETRSQIALDRVSSDSAGTRLAPVPTMFMGFPVRVDRNIDPGTVEFQHKDGRVDVLRLARRDEASAAPIGRFGHHPDPAIDLCVEIDDIVAEFANLRIGFGPITRLADKIYSAMAFRVGGDEGAVKAKARLREIEAEFEAWRVLKWKDRPLVERLYGIAGGTLHATIENSNRAAERDTVLEAADLIAKLPDRPSNG